MDIGGYLWLIIDVAFVAALAAVMIYAIHRWRGRRKTRVEQEAEKQAVDRAYRD
jgi:membrane protein implicated in regulation of membrane protease activity